MPRQVRFTTSTQVRVSPWHSARYGDLPSGPAGGGIVAGGLPPMPALGTPPPFVAPPKLIVPPKLVPLFEPELPVLPPNVLEPEPPKLLVPPNCEKPPKVAKPPKLTLPDAPFAAPPEPDGESS